jgi:hypothetical protein
MNELEKENLELKDKVKNMERQIKILIRQCDEWIKSYDNLLKDFLAYRERKDR